MIYEENIHFSILITANNEKQYKCPLEEDLLHNTEYPFNRTVLNKRGICTDIQR
jgi:hypothetical protein